MVAAINDARIAVGKGPVGWINPAVRWTKYFRGFRSQLCSSTLTTWTVTALLAVVRRILQRRDEWFKPRLWNAGLPNSAWLGSRYRLGHAELQALAGDLPFAPLIVSPAFKRLSSVP